MPSHASKGHPGLAPSYGRAVGNGQVAGPWLPLNAEAAFPDSCEGASTRFSYYRSISELAASTVSPLFAILLRIICSNLAHFPSAAALYLKPSRSV